MSQNFQLVPFPVPEHLLYYFSRKLGSEVEEINNFSSCTASVIKKNTFYGEKIYSTLGRAKYYKTPRVNFYLKISNSLKRQNKKLPDGRYVQYEVLEDTIIFIEKYLKEMLKTELVAYVDGALFSYQTVKGTKKGITHKAIAKFMFENRINIDSSTFETFRKMHYRAKQKRKPFKVAV